MVEIKTLKDSKMDDLDDDNVSREENNQELPSIELAMELKAREGSVAAAQLLDKMRKDRHMREFKEKLLRGEV